MTLEDVRQLVYRMLRMAGMPTPILRAYRNYLEQLVTYYVIAGGLGTGRKRKCGIPQGCPLSMMVVALMMRPWILMVRCMGMQPRVLADDVLMIARGPSMLSKFAAALNATHGYLHAMGAKIAPAKSYNFASTKAAAVWLAETWWEHIQAAIQVVKDFRYLGVHLATQWCRVYTTLAARGSKAIEQLGKLQYISATAHSKAKTIRTQIYPGAFHGVESNDVPERVLGRISAAVVDAFSRRNDHYDPDWFYIIRSEGDDLDPALQQKMHAAQKEYMQETSYARGNAELYAEVCGLCHRSRHRCVLVQEGRVGSA